MYKIFNFWLLLWEQLFQNVHGILRAVCGACSPSLSPRTCFSSLCLPVSGRSLATFNLLGNIQGLCAAVEECAWCVTSLDNTSVTSFIFLKQELSIEDLTAGYLEVCLNSHVPASKCKVSPIHDLCTFPCLTG